MNKNADPCYALFSKEKKNLKNLFNLFSLALVTSLLYVSPVEAQNVTLPIEVIGPDGYTVSVTVDVDDPSGINRLWMQVYRPEYKYGDGGKNSKGLSYDGSLPKASVRINNGSWTHIDNKSATCAFPENKFDCIAGPFSTKRFTIPVSGIKQGSNTIDFRFNGSEGLTIGWRVLHLNFLKNNYNGPLSVPAVKAAGAITSGFRYEQYADWEPPIAGQSAINAGKNLYENASIKEGGGNKVIKATCADCHSANGRDLKYFNYSNRSIIERSKFHGLSQTEGEQIASYIRSLNYPAVGTPWDPPYQPGPERSLPTVGDCVQGERLDDLPSHCWAAGAGLDWVLDNDEDMLPHLFPDGINASRVANDKRLSTREIPIAIQMPDWNGWLPRMHPKDSLPNVFPGHALNKKYQNDIPNALGNGTIADWKKNNLTKVLEQWGEGGYITFKKAYLKSGNIPGLNQDQSNDAILGVPQWVSVKSWEIMTSNEGLEEAGDELHPNGESRAWPGTYRHVFQVAPHLLSVKPYGPEFRSSYYSTTWYELQTIISAGNGDGGSVRPMDWRYQYGHLSVTGRKGAGVKNPLRYYKSFIKASQEGLQQYYTDGRKLTPETVWGLNMSPARLFGFNTYNTNKDSFKDMKETVRAEISEAAMKAQVDMLNLFSPNAWQRSTAQCCMEPASFTPTAHTGGGRKFDLSTYANHYYRSIPLFLDMGVDKDVLHDLAQWAKSMWPKGNWDSLVPNPNNDNKRPTASITSPSNGKTFPAMSDITITAQASDQDGSIKKVEFLNAGTKIGEDTTAPYSYKWQNVLPGTYWIGVHAIDNGGKSRTPAFVRVIVSNDGDPDPGPDDTTPPTVQITTPADGTIHSGTINITANASDDTNVAGVQFKVNGFNLGNEDRSAPYSVALDTLTLSNDFHLISAEARDDANNTASDSVTIEVFNDVGPTPPGVTMTSPNNNQTFTIGDSIILSANASDNDGTVTKVEFFNGNTKIGEDTTSPYSMTLTNPAIGSYQLKARAIDNDNQSTDSTSVNVTVSAPDQQLVVNITTPSDGQTFNAPATFTITAVAIDDDIVQNMKIFQNNNRIVKEFDVTTLNHTINNLGAGTYTFYARALDHKGDNIESDRITITVIDDSPSNEPPVVNITSPSDNESFIEGETISLQATASDVDGSVTMVEFYNGNTKIGEDTSAPYSFDMNNVAAGSYTLKAKATDNDGDTTMSASINVSVNELIRSVDINNIEMSGDNYSIQFTTEGFNNGDGGYHVHFYYDNESNTVTNKMYSGPSPYVLLKSSKPDNATQLCSSVANSSHKLVNPAEFDCHTLPKEPNKLPSASFTASVVSGEVPLKVDFDASSSTDPDGSIIDYTWDFGDGSSGIGIKPSHTFESIGEYAVSLTVTDNEGAKSVSNKTTITVLEQPNVPPSVTLTSPSNGDTFTAPADITLAAEAKDADGSIARVEFYNGNTKLGEDTSAPYMFNWKDVKPGTYIITAKATDNDNAISTSSLAEIHVKSTANLPPSVTLSYLSDTEILTAPADIVLLAKASDVDGSVSKVEFYQGLTKLGEDTTAPYSFDVKGLKTGTHSFSAKVTDNEEATALSNNVDIKVITTPDPTPGSVIGETGVVAFNQPNNDTWHTVKLNNIYKNPIVVMGPPSYNGSQPTTMRVRNVSPNSFEYQIDEWEYLDGFHVIETIGYMVVEQGTHTLADGSVIQAGSSMVDHNISNISFTQPFSNVPVVLNQVASVNENTAVTTRTRSVQAHQFKIELQEEEAEDDKHTAEAVHWIAISQGSNGLFEAKHTGNDISSEWSSVNFSNKNNPIILANMQTRNGSHPAVIRHRNLNSSQVVLMIEEEQSKDKEMDHVNEEVGLVIFDQPGDIIRKK